MKFLQNTSSRLLTTLLFLFVSSITINLVQADELAIPVGSQGAEKSSLERPKVGMTSIAVEAKFGAPLSKSTAVGTPPISSWDYPHYKVYFESERVIHSVLKPYSDEAAAPAVQPVTETAPAPAQAPIPEATPALEAAPN
jgi:hypothetical protein